MTRPYTITNLRRLENMSARFGYPDDFEARFARQALESERIGLSYQRLGPNAEAPFGHSHRRDEEIYLVLGGSGQITVGGDIREIGAWDAIRVAPQAFRTFTAGPEGMELIAFGTHTDGDVVMGPRE